MLTRKNLLMKFVIVSSAVVALTSGIMWPNWVSEIRAYYGTSETLTFASFEGTWWKTLKQMDKGYVVLHPAVEDSNAKAKKVNDRLKMGYMYAPPGCFDDDTDTYVGVLGLDYNGDGGWLVTPYDLVIMGGTPVDLIVHTEMDILGARMALTARAKLIENKKDPGTIKSGQVKTVGSFIMYDLPSDKGFFGTRDFRAKFIEENKVPTEVIEAKDQFLSS